MKKIILVNQGNSENLGDKAIRIAFENILNILLTLSELKV